MADPEFRVLLEQVIAGDQEAIGRLVREYGPDLRQVVHRLLPLRLRPRFDSLDFTQDVWASFFADLPQGRTFEAPADLAAFLGRVARYKIVQAIRHHLITKKANAMREQPLNGGGAADQLPSRQATPSVVAMSREEWQRLLKTQPLLYRRILILVRQGKTTAEAALAVGVSERTARRLVNKLLPGWTP